MKSWLQATMHLREEEVKVERIKDERTGTIPDHYFVIRVGELTMFVEPVAFDRLMRSLRIANKRRGFDDTIRDQGANK